MPSRVVTKVIRAAAIALAVELADLAMDKTMLSADKFRLVRKILKAGVGAACGALLAKVLHEAGEAAAGEAAVGQAAGQAAAGQAALAAEHA